jgi:hypothetical protein
MKRSDPEHAIPEIAKVGEVQLEHLECLRRVG